MNRRSTTTEREREREREREKRERERQRQRETETERDIENDERYTSGFASARALTSALSVQARQPAVHPPWATVDSSLGCHGDRSTARAVGASETPSRGCRRG